MVSFGDAAPLCKRCGRLDDGVVGAGLRRVMMGYREWESVECGG